MLILGGDLYKGVSSDKFELTNDTWFYEGNNIEESIGKALNNFQEQQIL